jgi:hypothetical protein
MPPQPGGAGITSRVEAARHIPANCLVPCPPVPRAVTFELTARKRRRERRTGMEWGLYTRLVGEIVDTGVEQLGLTFAHDSLPCDWQPEAIAFAKGRGIRYVFMTTGGELAPPEVVLRAFEAGLDSLTFAGQPNATYLKAARRLRDLGNFACGLYACTLEGDGAPPMDEILPYLDDHYWLPKRALQPCWSAFTEGHVTSDGKLCACRLDERQRLIMADLNEFSFRDGWHSARFQELRAAQLRKEVAGTPCAECLG